MRFDDQATVNPGRFLSALALEELTRHGLGLVIACPGGRNQPLLGAVAARDDLDVLRVVDERAAGHLALGWLRGQAAAGREPTMAVVITTSGSAPLLLAPALAEAQATGLPLVLLSADRPVELHGVGANQTLDQRTPLAPFARIQRHLECYADGTTPVDVLQSVAELAAGALAPSCGPAHLNLAFREPLAPDPEPLPTEWVDQIANWPDGRQPWAARPARASVPDDQLQRLRLDLTAAQRPVVWLAGLTSHQQRQAATALALTIGAPVVADIGSGARFQPEPLTRLRHAEFYPEALAPCDLVLQIGHQPVSLPLVNALSHARRWVVCDHPGRQDPARQGGEQLHATPDDIAGLVASGDPDWTRRLGDLDRAWARRLTAVIDDSDVFNEAWVVRQLLRQLPANHGLYLSNSLAVRVADTVVEQGQATILTNRGTSGIEGQLAQAVGAARGLDRPTVALVGDVTCQHDLGSLMLLAESGLPLLVLVLQNRGGAIFRRLAAQRHPQLLDPWLTAHHEVDLCAVAGAHGLHNRRVDQRGGLANALTDFLHHPEPTLLEAVVPADGHARLLVRLEEDTP